MNQSMIRRIVRWSAGLGMAGALFLASGIAENLTALALPEEEVFKKLEHIPVFTITDEQGAPLVASAEDENKLAGVFISPQDANNFLAQVKNTNPDLADKVKVVPISLAEVYKLSQSAQSQQDALNFQYVPEEEAVNSAKTISEANQEPFPGGVPLFVARGGEENNYLTVQPTKDSPQMIPFFFDKQQLEQLIAQSKKQKPEVAEQIDIQVVPLEGIIETLKTKEDPAIKNIFIVPTNESLQFVNGSGANIPPAGEAAPAPVSPEN